ncbi:hypothetical protein L7F22_035921 [Adiantum nelumboides]|nr:hypothetical protein [Adiantum nelumboides]
MGSIACHWDLNEIPTIEQQLEWIEPSMEMLGLQQLVDINQIYSASDAEVDVLLDDRDDFSDSKEMQDLYEMAQQPCIDAFAFASDRYFAFDKVAYILMIASIERRQGVTIDSLKVVDKCGLLDLRKWARIQALLHTVTNEEEAKRSRLKPFIKVVNYNHIMPTKYTLDADLKNAVVLEKLDAKAKRVK